MSEIAVHKTPPDAQALVRRKSVRESIGGGAGFYSYTGYRSASTSGLNTGTTATAGRKVMEYDRPSVVQASRDLYRNNPIYNGVINSAVDYIVGTGHKLQIIAKDPAQQELANELEKMFDKFWNSPTINGQSGGDLERMVIQELFICGDTFVLKIDTGLLQQIESEQVAGRQKEGYNDGVMTDDYGNPTSFNVCTYRNGYITGRNGAATSAENVMFLATTDRPSDIRALPPAQSSFGMFHRINDLCDSETIAAQTLARFAVSVTSETGATGGYNNSVTDTSLSQEAPMADRVTDLGYAMIFNGNIGEKIEGISRNIPGKDFPATIRTFLRLLGLPLGMPLEIIFLDWTQSNYSQSRAVLEHSKRKFATWQKLLQNKLLAPTLDWKYREWVSKGQIAEFEFTANWIGPAFPWLDPQKEAEAMARQIETSQATQHDVLQTQGKDYDAFMNMRQTEVGKALEIVNALKEEYGIEVPYETFAGLPYPNKSDNKSKSETETDSPSKEAVKDEQ